MAGVKQALAAGLLGFCVLAGMACGFVVEKQDGPQSAWQFSLDGYGVDEPVLAKEQGGRLVGELNGFQIKGYESNSPGVTGSGAADNNQFSDSSFAGDVPEQFGSSDVDANQFQGQTPDNAASYDYNRFSALPERIPAPATQFNRQPSSTSYVLGSPEEKTVETHPDYVYDARAGGGGADGASFTASDSFQQQSSSNRKVVPVKGHQGPVSYYTPASDRNGAFVFYDTRSDEEKKLDSAVHRNSASFASSDITTSASTAPVNGTTPASHGCPNSYWAQHVDKWPAPLKRTTLVSEAFEGATVKKTLVIIYGTTTIFQALLDSRDDPYSKLLRHAVAALLNAHAKSAYPFRPAEVAQLFHAALASRTAAAAQAQKFENENHAFGDSECK